MFRCNKCEMNSKPKEKPNKVVAETRKRLYYDSYKELEGVGWEIVKEIFLCNRCNTNKEKLNGRRITALNS